MTKIPKILALFSLVALALTSCENSIITDDPGSLDNRNIELRITNYWGSNYFSRDSVYNKNGANFIVDDVQLLISNFYVNNSGDTVVDYSSFTLTSTKRSIHRIGLITDESVSGSIGYLVGLDSIANATSPGNWGDGDVLSNGEIYSNSKIGYHFVTVTGRAFNPSKPDETSPSLPFNWVVATNALFSKQDIQRNFSVPRGKQVLIDAALNVDALFDDLSPVDIPNIESDPDDADDFANAVILRDNFNNKAYIFN